MNKKSKASTRALIADNRKARHNYFIEERFEAGIVLQGWEVKSIRAGRVQLSESHIIFKKGEAWLLGSNITPLLSASTHIRTDADRTRKLLLNKKELSHLYGSVERKGYTLVPLSMFWKRGNVKIEIALAKGKKQYDKRATLKEREWKLDKARALKNIKK